MRLLRDWITALTNSSSKGNQKRKNSNKGKFHRSLRFESLEDKRVLAPITVNTDLDVNNPSDGLTTLREAVVAASIGGGDTINFDGLPIGATITLDRVNLGQIEFGKSLTIDATGRNITIDADDPTPFDSMNPAANRYDGIRIFNITDPTNGASPPLVTLKGLTLTGADPSTNSGNALRLNWVM